MRVLVFFVLILFLISFLVYAQHKTVVYFFWRQGCPHCEAEETFLEDMKIKYPEVEVKEFEVSSKENSELFAKMSKAYGTDPVGVPMTFIGEEYFIGYGDYKTSGKFMEEAIANCIENGCVDPIEKVGTIAEENSLTYLIVLLVLVVLVFTVFWFYRKKH